MRDFVIGTAGHIDHGKTALIRALTGRDVDRLPEEKQRGITTDLGFAFFDLGGGKRAGVIDVPGHEKFIHNMAAGAGGMDLVLLVIAADEGMMPQTAEHLDILALLGVRDYIVVLNKCDLADREWLDMAEEEVRRELTEWGIDDAPLVRVSAKTGRGIDLLKEKIREYAVRNREEKEETRRLEVPFRLPVDRVFSAPGYGTIAAGTVFDGQVEKGRELVLYPSGKCCKVKGIQVCETQVSVCRAGQRAALNLSGVDRTDVARGCVLALPGSLQSSRMFNVRLHILKRSRRLVKNQSRLHLYCGATRVLCRAALLDTDCLGPGESGLVQLRLESDAVLKRGDRFVVRFYSPLETIGGGVVLETDCRREKRFREDTLERLRAEETADPEKLTELAVKARGPEMADLSWLCLRLGEGEKVLQEQLENLCRKGRLYQFEGKGGTYFLHRDMERSLQKDVLGKIRGYLEQYPYRLGMPEAQVLSQACSGLKKEAGDGYVRWLAENQILECLEPARMQSGRFLSWKPGGRLYRPAGYEPGGDGACEIVERIFSKAAREGGYHFPSLGELDFPGVGQEALPEILRLLEWQGKAAYLSGDFYTLPVLAEKAGEKIRKLAEQNGKIRIVQVCALFDTSRKNARLLLEYTDRAGITKKNGAESERVKA